MLGALSGDGAGEELRASPRGADPCPAPVNDSRVTNPSLARGQAGQTDMSDLGRPWSSSALSAFTDL